MKPAPIKVVQKPAPTCLVCKLTLGSWHDHSSCPAARPVLELLAAYLHGEP